MVGNSLFLRLFYIMNPYLGSKDPNFFFLLGNCVHVNGRFELNDDETKHKYNNDGHLLALEVEKQVNLTCVKEKDHRNLP